MFQYPSRMFHAKVIKIFRMSWVWFGKEWICFLKDFELWWKSFWLNLCKSNFFINCQFFRILFCCYYPSINLLLDSFNIVWKIHIFFCYQALLIRKELFRLQEENFKAWLQGLMSWQYFGKFDLELLILQIRK